MKKVMKFRTCMLMWLLLTGSSVLAQENAGTETTPRGDMTVKSHFPEITNVRRLGVIEKDKVGKTSIRLERTYVKGNLILLRMILNNRSAISYDVEFIRFYIRDRRTLKRTISQELEILPMHTAIPARIHAGSQDYLLFAINKFTLADDKILSLEVFEKGGGRHFEMMIHQKDLDRAVLIPGTSDGR